MQFRRSDEVGNQSDKHRDVGRSERRPRVRARARARARSGNEGAGSMECHRLCRVGLEEKERMGNVDVVVGQMVLRVNHTIPGT
jgi:hypothetical protein